MPETPTPGQSAYEAYWRSTNPRLRGYPWQTMEPGEQAHWEAAAQAVLDQATVRAVAVEAVQAVLAMQKEEDPHV